MATSLSEDFSSIGITKDFLEEALNSKWGGECATPMKIDRFTVSKGSVIGDGYTTILLSVDVWLENHEKFVQFQSDWYRTTDVTSDSKPSQGDAHAPLSFVVKCFPENVARQVFLENMDVFTTEYGVYNKVTPEFINFQKEMNLTKIIKPDFLPMISGKALTVQEMKALKETRPLKPLDNFIIMMDIRKHGKFQLRDRFLGFDLDHYKLVVEAHAKLHAISWAYTQRKGIPDLRSVFPFLQMQQMADGMQMMTHLFNANLDVARCVVKNAMGGNEKILNSLDELQKMEKMVEAFLLYYEYDDKFTNSAPSTDKAPALVSKFTKDSILKVPGPVNENEEPWQVLLHGDAWSNNMLFRYDEATGRPIQIILLDLQISRVGDPVTDIVYALYSGTTKEFRDKHLESMLHVYHDKFIEVCQHFNVPPLPGFTWSEFKRRFHRAKMFGLSLGLMVIPVTLKNPDRVVDMDTMTLAEPEVKQEEGKTAEELEIGVKIEQMQGFMEKLFSKDDEFSNYNPAMVERMSGLLQSMSDDGIL